MRPSIRYNGNYVILLMSVYVVVRNIYTRKALVRQIGNVFLLSPLIFSSQGLKRSLAGPVVQVLTVCQIFPIPI